MILDVVLPGIDGYEVAATLRRLYGDGLPIVVITADGRRAEQGRGLGAVAALAKPFDPNCRCPAGGDALHGPYLHRRWLEGGRLLPLMDRAKRVGGGAWESNPPATALTAAQRF